MKHINSEEIVINYNYDERKEINNYFNCISISKALHYLEKEDIIQLSKCSKSTNSYIESNNLLFLNLLYRNQSQ